MHSALGWKMLVLSCGCATVGAAMQPEHPGLRLARSQPEARLWPDAGTIPGYQHVIGASRFHMGGNVHTDTFGVFSRSVGADAVFAVDRFSGMVVATQDSWSPARSVAAYSTDMATHAALVRTYFVGAGLPADQIAAVGSSTRRRAWHRPRRGPQPVAEFIAHDSDNLSGRRGLPGAGLLRRAVQRQRRVGARDRLLARAPRVGAGRSDRSREPTPRTGQGPAYLGRLPIPPTSPVVRIHHTGGGGWPRRHSSLSVRATSGMTDLAALRHRGQ